MQKQSIVIEPHETIKEFRLYLYERENAKATIDKYLTDVNTFYKFLNHNYEISKQRVLEYKEWLQRHYAVSSANSMLAALSQFLEFLGVSSMKVKRFKVQRQMILQEDQLLSEEEYHTLVNTAYKKGQKSLALIMETIAATGIRISELKYFTIRAVKCGNIMYFIAFCEMDTFCENPHFPFRASVPFFFLCRMNDIFYFFLLLRLFYLPLVEPGVLFTLKATIKGSICNMQILPSSYFYIQFLSRAYFSNFLIVIGYLKISNTPICNLHSKTNAWNSGLNQ